MSKIIDTFIIFMFLVVSGLSAKDISGVLSAGEESVFVPLQGSAFSINSDITSGIYDGKFNIIIRSGGEIIYEENNQEDDLYLVFNEPVSSGDNIKLNVLKGVFKFKVSHMDTLPSEIVDAIQQQAPKVYEQLKPLHQRVQNEVQYQQPVIEPYVPVVEPIPTYTPAKIIENDDFDSRVVKRAVDPKDYIAEKPYEMNVPIVPTVSQKSVEKKVEEVKKESIKSDKNAPNIISTTIDEINKKISSIIRFQSNPKAIDKNEIKSDIKEVSKNSIEKPSSFTQKTNLPNISTSLPKNLQKVEKPSGLQNNLPTISTPKSDIKKFTPKVEQKNDFKPYESKIEKQVVQKPMFRETKPNIIVNSQPTIAPIPKMNNVNNFPVSSIEKRDVQRPTFRDRKPKVIVQKITPSKIIEAPKMKPSRILPVAPKIKPTIEPKIVEYKEPQIVHSTMPEPEIIIPPVASKPRVIKHTPSKDKIVITKTISAKKKQEKVDKYESRVIKRHVPVEDYNNQEEHIPERMSDRVLGTGYGMASQGHIKVQAFSNNRPISAWVEVFKSGTKQRVKTFYTGRGSSLKDVKLPAGVYVIKATYRTAGSKRKKTIGKVSLQEGESINKTITFDDGSITIKVTKNGEPIYARVEVFKSGKKRRIAYEFSSKTDGIATLSLGSGTYDIVVKDHANVKRFNSVKISGSKGKTFNADF